MCRNIAASSKRRPQMRHIRSTVCTACVYTRFRGFPSGDLVPVRNERCRVSGSVVWADYAFGRHVIGRLKMVKPGIHFPQQFITVVLRNGATFQMSSIVKMTQPIFLEQDPTNNPLWTGKQVQDIKEESRAAKFLEKFSKLGIKGGSSS